MSCQIMTAAGRPLEKAPCLVLGTSTDAGQKRLAGPWQRSRSKDGGEKNRLPAVPRWKMIPRFKTRVYVLFVFPALSVSVEGQHCERETLVFHWQGSKLLWNSIVVFKPSQWDDKENLLLSSFCLTFFFPLAWSDVTNQTSLHINMLDLSFLDR